MPNHEKRAWNIDFFPFLIRSNPLSQLPQFTPLKPHKFHLFPATQCAAVANKENYSVKSEIEKALLALLSKKEYTSITVTDLVKEAKVARVSFYRYFSSIPDVLDSIADQTAQKLNIEFLPPDGHLKRA